MTARARRTETAGLDGSDYVCVRGTLRSKVPDGSGGFTLVVAAAEGETCERVNPASLPWLLEQGYIEPVKKDA